MGDHLVGCDSYTTPEFHVNQEPNVGTSTAVILYAALMIVILAVKPLKNIMSENIEAVFLRLLLNKKVKLDN